MTAIQYNIKKARIRLFYKKCSRRFFGYKLGLSIDVISSRSTESLVNMFINMTYYMDEEICGLCNRTIALVEGTDLCKDCYDTAKIIGENYEKNLKVSTDKEGQVHRHLVNKRFKKVLLDFQSSGMVRPVCDECAEAMGF